MHLRSSPGWWLEMSSYYCKTKSKIITQMWLFLNVPYVNLQSLIKFYAIISSFCFVVAKHLLTTSHVVGDSAQFVTTVSAHRTTRRTINYVLQMPAEIPAYSMHSLRTIRGWCISGKSCLHNTVNEIELDARLGSITVVCYRYIFTVCFVCSSKEFTD